MTHYVITLLQKIYADICRAVCWRWPRDAHCKQLTKVVGQSLNLNCMQRRIEIHSRGNVVGQWSAPVGFSSVRDTNMFCVAAVLNDCPHTPLRRVTSFCRVWRRRAELQNQVKLRLGFSKNIRKPTGTTRPKNWAQESWLREEGDQQTLHSLEGK